MMPRCRDCKLYDLDAVKSKSGAVLAHRIGRCLWVSTEVLPASVSDRYSRAATMGMKPDEGQQCPCFIDRENTHE